VPTTLLEEAGPGRYWPGAHPVSHAAYLRRHRRHQKKWRGKRGRSCRWYKSAPRHAAQRRLRAMIGWGSCSSTATGVGPMPYSVATRPDSRHTVRLKSVGAELIW